jgi:hypothetical protein
MGVLCVFAFALTLKPLIATAPPSGRPPYPCAVGSARVTCFTNTALCHPFFTRQTSTTRFVTPVHAARQGQFGETSVTRTRLIRAAASQRCRMECYLGHGVLFGSHNVQPSITTRWVGWLVCLFVVGVWVRSDRSLPSKLAPSPVLVIFGVPRTFGCCGL